MKNNDLMVLALVGTNGSGKGVVVGLLKKFLDLHHFSARDMIIDLAKKDGVNIENRDHLREYNEKRNREGKTLIQEMKKEIDQNIFDKKIYIFESLRRVSEIKELKDYFGDNFKLIAVDAPLELRYQRIVERGTMADKIDFEKFKEQERLESINEDENQMNIPKCVSLADFVVENTGTMEDLEDKVKKIIINL